MALNKQIVDIPLAGGVETKLYSKLVGLGSSLTLANAKLDEVGVLAARPVFVANQTNADAVKLIAADGGGLNVVDRAQVEPLRIVETDLPGAPAGTYIRYTDSLTFGTYRLYITVGRASLGAVNDTLTYAIVDLATGRIVQQQATTGVSVVQAKLCMISNTRPTIWYLTTAGNLYSWSVYPGASVVQSLYKSGVEIGFDVAYEPTTLGGYVIYQKTSDHFVYVNNTSTGYTATSAPSFYRFGFNSYALAIPQATGVRLLDDTSDVFWAATTNYTPYTPIAVPYTSTLGGYAPKCLWVIPSKYSSGTSIAWRTDVVDSLNVRRVTGVGALLPMSQAYNDGTFVYWWALADSPITALGGTNDEFSVQATYVLCRFDGTVWVADAAAHTRPFNIVAGAIKDSAMDAIQRSYFAGTHTCGNFDGTYAALITTPVQYKAVVNSVVQWYSTAKLVKSVFAAPLTSVSALQHTMLTGGLGYEFDQNNVYESNFNQYPEILGVTYGIGGTIPNGPYYLKCTYKHLDTKGNAHESATSATATAVLSGGNNEIDIVVSNYVAGQRPWRLVVYASTDNISFYEVGSTALTLPTAAQAGTQTIPVTTLAGMTSNPELYTDGWVLDNAAVPSFTGITTYSGRFWGVTANGKLYYSKPIVEGEGVAWLGEVGTQILNTDPGEYWQIAAIDGYLVVIGENTVQVITGDGIDNLGTASSSSLTAPRAIPVNSGTLRNNPILANDDGIWFKAVHGLQLLERNMAVTHIPGLPVDAYTPSTLTAITSVPGEHELRFVLSDGTMLIRDGVTNAWSTQAIPTGASDAALVGATHYLLATGGVIYAPNNTYDVTKKLTLVTPWIRLGQVQAIQRVTNMVLGFDWQSNCTATIKLYYDYNETVSETLTHAMTTGTVGEMKQFRWHLGKRCEAVKIGVEIASATAGAKLVSMALELAVKGGLIRLDSSGNT